MSHQTVSANAVTKELLKVSQTGATFPGPNPDRIPGTGRPTYNQEFARAAADMYGPAANAISSVAGPAANAISSVAGTAGKHIANAGSAAGNFLANNPVTNFLGGLGSAARTAGNYVKDTTGPRRTTELNAAGQADAQAYNAADTLKYLLMGAAGGLGVGGVAALMKQTQKDDLEDEDVYYDTPLTVGDTLAKLKKRKRGTGLFREPDLSKSANILNVTMHPADKSPVDKPSTGLLDVNWGDFAFPVGAAAAIPAFITIRDLMAKKQKDVKKQEQQQELDAAQREFDTARALQYEAVMRRKAGAEAIKEANTFADIASPFVRVTQDMYGGLSNAITGRTAQPTSAGFKDYLVGALLLSLGAHYAGRRTGATLTSDKSKDDIRKRVLRERRAQLASSPYSALPMTAVDIPYKTDVVDAESVLPKL